MSEMLAHALDYAARGLPVFPCNPSAIKPYSKRPLTEHGFKDASTDPEQIKAWWTKWPAALIGGRMGRDAGLFGIDPDVPKEEGDPDGLASWHALVAEHGGIPHTHSHESPSGGLHVLFRWDDTHPVTNREGSLPAGINVRGEGGYLIFPPSKLADGKAYRLADEFDYWNFAEAPGWLLELIETKLEKPVDISTHVPAEAPRAAGSHDRYVAAAVEKECQAVLQEPKGGRNNRLNTAAFNLGTIVGAGALTSSYAVSRLLDAAKGAGLVAQDGQRAVMATIESGMTSGAQRPRKMPEPRAPLAQRAQAKSHASNDVAPGNVGNDLLTEDEAAFRFAETYNDRLRYCHDHGAWFEWTGSIWKRNGTGLAFHWARELARKLAAEEPDKTRITASKAAFAAAVERFARSDPAFAVTSDYWDRDPFLLGTPNGTVDLRTGALRPSDPKDGITKTTAVAPSKTADCPHWLRFLDETTGADAEMVRFLQQWAGYSLTGDTREHALCFVFGGGGNGKSVYLNVTSGVIGDYATTAAMETFISSGGDKHPTDLAMLRGARLVTASETEEGRQWAESRIKQLTGGDKISARFMRQDYFTFLPSFKLTIIGNHKPVLRNIDDAARRRFNLVPFTRTPAKPDRQLEEKLKAEWPGILRWMIAGCLDWQANGLARPSSVVEATKAYFEQQDTFAAWIEEECDADPGNNWKWETSAKLFEAWSRYAKNAGEVAGTRKGFADQMQRRGFESSRSHGGTRTYKGVMLRKPADNRQAEAA